MEISVTAIALNNWEFQKEIFHAHLTHTVSLSKVKGLIVDLACPKPVAVHNCMLPWEQSKKEIVTSSYSVWYYRGIGSTLASASAPSVPLPVGGESVELISPPGLPSVIC